MADEAPIDPARHNEVLQDHAVRTLLRFSARGGADFDSTELISRLGGLEAFPAVSVGGLLAIARSSGLHLNAAHADVDEAIALERPFLTYLRRGPNDEAGVDLVHVEEVRARSVIIARDLFGTQRMPRSVFEQRWSGLLLFLPRHDGQDGQEVAGFRKGVRVIPALLTPPECTELIRYCEAACFRRSRVLQRRPGGETDAVDSKVRSSSSVVLNDRRHPVLARLYRACAEMEGVDERDIEQIQCVRYKRHQRFRPHFDAGVDLPRLATYLLYLNDDFQGGGTHFPMLDLTVDPKAGSCLRFDSCHSDGRVVWPSEHGGLPVTSGVKYALNIWVRCPRRVARLVGRVSEPVLAASA